MTPFRRLTRIKETANGVVVPVLESRPQRGGRSGRIYRHRRGNLMFTRGRLLGGLTAACLAAAAMTSPATAVPAPPDTTVTPTYGPATTITWTYVDTSDSCLAKIGGVTADNRRVGGSWGIGLLVYNLCTDELVLGLRALGTNTGTSGLRVSATKHTATFSATGTLHYTDEEGNLGATAGTFSINQRLTLGAWHSEPAPGTDVFCLPLETDDTGLPVPGTLWTKYHFTVGLGVKHTVVTGATGTWTADLNDGTHMEFSAPPASVGGFAEADAGAVVSQISAPSPTCPAPH